MNGRGDSARCRSGRRGRRTALVVLAALVLGCGWLAASGAMSSGVAGQEQHWPDRLDLVASSLFLAAVVIVPAFGYWFLLADVRAYLRSLCRAVTVVARRYGGIPVWAKPYTPPSIAALGLSMPCRDTDVLAAYRARVKVLHPDLGGDPQRFLRLQRHLESALEFLRSQPEADSGPAPAGDRPGRGPRQ